MSRADLQTRLLRRQLKVLRAENRRLRRRIDAMRRTSGAEHEDVGDALPQEIRDRFHRIADNGQRLGLRGYPAYLLACLRATSVWSFWQRLLTAARRYRVLTAVLRGTAMVVAWLETSAFVLIYATVFLLTVPVLLVSSFVLLIVGLFQHRRCNAMLAERLAGRRVLVCFADRDALIDADSYFCGMVRDFAARPDTAVIVVSPYFRSGRGMGTRKVYITLCREEAVEGEIYLIRRHYYFSLRRHVLNAIGDRVILMH